MRQAFNELYKRQVISIGALRQAVLDGILTKGDYEYIAGQEWIETE